jgi:hypothetical protein
MQAYNEGLIDNPIISLVASSDTLTIGELDKKNCHSWTHYDQQHPWTLSTEFIDALGYKYDDAIAVGSINLSILVIMLLGG